MFVCSAYRPPEFPLRDFIEELNKDLGKIPENAEIVLLGDLNVDYNQRTTDKWRMQQIDRTNRSNKSLRHQRESQKKRNQ